VRQTRDVPSSAPEQSRDVRQSRRPGKWIRVMTDAGPPDDGLAEWQELLLATDTLQDFLGEVAGAAARDLGGEMSCGVTVRTHKRRPTTLGTSDSFAAALDEAQYFEGQGPCLHALNTGETITIARHLDRRAVAALHRAERRARRQRADHAGVRGGHRHRQRAAVPDQQHEAPRRRRPGRPHRHRRATDAPATRRVDPAPLTLPPGRLGAAAPTRPRSRRSGKRRRDRPLRGRVGGRRSRLKAGVRKDRVLDLQWSSSAAIRTVTIW
jgi:hypothetical protein